MMDMKKLRTMLLFAALAEILLCFPQHDVGTSPRQLFTTDACHNMELMKHYLALTYPDIIPPVFLYVDSLTSEDLFIIRNNETFYRFLSIVSGMPTPYNHIPGNIRIEGNDWIYCQEHIDLVKWYAQNMDSISCGEFEEYYNLINYTSPDLKKGEEFSDYVDRIGLHQDSINTSLTIFKSRYHPNKKEDELLFPWNSYYNNEDFSKIKTLIKSKNKITFILKTR